MEESNYLHAAQEHYRESQKHHQHKNNPILVIKIMEMLLDTFQLVKIEIIQPESAQNRKIFWKNFTNTQQQKILQFYLLHSEIFYGYLIQRIYAVVSITQQHATDQIYKNIIARKKRALENIPVQIPIGFVINFKSNTKNLQSFQSNFGQILGSFKRFLLYCQVVQVEKHALLLNLFDSYFQSISLINNQLFPKQIQIYPIHYSIQEAVLMIQKKKGSKFNQFVTLRNQMFFHDIHKSRLNKYAIVSQEQYQAHFNILQNRIQRIDPYEQHELEEQQQLNRIIHLMYERIQRINVLEIIDLQNNW